MKLHPPAVCFLAAVFCLISLPVWAAPARPRLGPKAALDLEDLDRLGVDPLTGRLELFREDLRLGEGAGAFLVRRVYAPGAGIDANLGSAWTSALDQRLEPMESGDWVFVDERGQRRRFGKTGDGSWKATRGRPARLVSKGQGLILAGLGDGRTYRFGVRGALASVRDSSGELVVFVRDRRGRLLKVRGAWGVLELGRNSAGRLVRLSGPGGVTVGYGSSSAGELVSVVRRGLRSVYSYEAGRLVSLAEGRARLAYDAAGRVVAVEGPGVRELRAEYLVAYWLARRTGVVAPGD